MIDYKNINNSLESLYYKSFNCKPLDIIELPKSGSERLYFRIKGKKDEDIIGVWNPNQKENETFFYFTDCLRKIKIPVPFIFSKDVHQNIYLLEDLGDTSLMKMLEDQEKKSFSPKILDIYKRVIEQLVTIQLVTDKYINYKKTYSYQQFDKQVVQRDLFYFKGYFLDQLQVVYNKPLLLKEFGLLMDYFTRFPHQYFMYRDFQSRNIMLKEDKHIYFIDYQGGMKGPLQYDLVSLLYQAKARIPKDIKSKLLKHYLSCLRENIVIDEVKFIEGYESMALLRVLQTLGAYGKRGIKERKKHFIQSIPLAINNLEYIFGFFKLRKSCPELSRLIQFIIEHKELFKNL